MTVHGTVFFRAGPSTLLASQLHAEHPQRLPASRGPARTSFGRRLVNSRTYCASSNARNGWGSSAVSRSGSRLGEGMVRLHRGTTLVELDPDAAFDDLSMAESLFGDVGADPYRARAIHANAMLLETMGRNDEARARLMEASQLFDELGIKPDPILCE
jgi:hypothetical protein